LSSIQAFLADLRRRARWTQKCCSHQRMPRRTLAASAMEADALQIPKDATCPISQQVMEDPVVCADGHSYERWCIQEWFARGHRTSPKTNEPLSSTVLIPNISLRNTIEELTHKMPVGQKGQVLMGRVKLKQTLSRQLDLMEDLNVNEHKCDDVGEEPPHYMPNRTSSSRGGVLSSKGIPDRLQMIAVNPNDFWHQQRRSGTPSGSQLRAYARYLGIDPVIDNDLLWIASDSLEAPLPAQWSEHYDGLERVFYFNAVTEESRWRHPSEQAYRDAYQLISSFRHGTMSPEDRVKRLDELRRDAQARERCCHEELAQWTEHVDEDGHRFYFNLREQQSTWTDPRPAVREAVNVRLKALYTATLTAGSLQLAVSTPGGASPNKASLSQVSLGSPSPTARPAKLPKGSNAVKKPALQERLPSRPVQASRTPSHFQAPQPSSPRQSYWDELFSMKSQTGSPTKGSLGSLGSPTVVSV